MILNRLSGLGCAALVLALAVLLSGCDPQKPAASATPAAHALAPAVTSPAAQQVTAPSSSPQPGASQQRVESLIQQVEKAYALGDAAYKHGNLPEAKSNFDNAVDLMLSSGIDIRSTPALQDEFDRIVDQINSLEMDALKLGNGFTPKTEDTPAEAASDITFVVDPNIVAKANADLATTKSDLPLVVNDYVASYINFFANTTKGHNTLLHSFQRAGRYRAMIQRVMSEEGVPQDLIYLAVAESGFQPRAINARSRAGGMWQFMPYGNYGLTRNGYVDERFDPEKSTRAYARYMKYIYSELGDWYLSMAGYDWGTGNIQRAVEKTGYADFWELYKRNNLPAETKNYVPEILAAIIIANHPTQYGFDDITFDPPVLTDTVTINYSADLRLVSDIVGAPVDELIALNPSLLRLVTPPDTAFDLHLPAGTAALFQDKIAAIPESKRNSWRYHNVTPEDTLASVAHTYSVSVSALAEANQLDQTGKLDGVEVARRARRSFRGPIGAHRLLHHPPRRHPGFRRRPIRRLPYPAPPLEQTSRHRHQDRLRPPPPRRRTRPRPDSAAAATQKAEPTAPAKSPALLRPLAEHLPVLTAPDRRHPHPMRATRLTPTSQSSKGKHSAASAKQSSHSNSPSSAQK